MLSIRVLHALVLIVTCIQMFLCLFSFFFFVTIFLFNFICGFRYPSEMEYALASVKPLIHKRKPTTDNPYDPTWKSYGHELPKPPQLPPLVGKPQV